ncbi:MAG: MmcQ/YjbR family DNA-binding protein [Oscillospiraceae bacterium]|nr:MmcQ/YjbR family DNA-binding protein [Oscillospiraceae bacterium]
MSGQQRSQRERITQYILDTYGTEAEYLWADSPGNAVFRHPASKKWYAALMRVLPEKLGFTGGDALDVMDIKCSTIMIGSLLSTKGFLPAYHMNKNHWISILLDGSIPDVEIFPLLELSYDSVAPKRKKRRAQPAEA